jgi:hypothetical protein
MNRKDKINLINQLEIGDIPIEMFQKPKLLLNKVDLSEFRNSRRLLHDEDLSLYDHHKLKFGINPYTGSFYGIIMVSIIK